MMAPEATPQYYLFPGCLNLYRFPGYELSARQVLSRLGISTGSLDRQTCCGGFLEGKTENWQLMAAYNLSLAEQKGAGLITLCGGCTNTFRRVIYNCHQDPELLRSLNRKLKVIGLEFHNTVGVKHVLQVLVERLNQLEAQIVQPLPKRAAMVYPCQIFRPDYILDFDNPQKPQVMARLGQIIGLGIVDYSGEYDCCGSTLQLSNREAAFRLGKQKVSAMTEAGAEIMVTACGNCHVLLDRLQSQYHRPVIPGYFITQLVGMAMGLSPREVMLSPRRGRRVLPND